MKPLTAMLLLFGVLLLLMAALVGSGDTGLIRSFNHTKVKDKKKYARFLGKVLALYAGSILLAALVSLYTTRGAVLVLVLLVIVVTVRTVKEADQHYC